MVQAANHTTTRSQKGRLVQYETKTGAIQKARLMYADQTALLAQVNKSILRLIDDNYEDLLDENGKKIVSLVRDDKLINIGFINYL